MTMAKISDFTKYVCDRCGKIEYLPADATTVNRWYQIKRITADTIPQDKLFCASCYQAYQELMVKQDAAYNDFMNNLEKAA
jgi:ribosomal protein S27AE